MREISEVSNRFRQHDNFTRLLICNSDTPQNREAGRKILDKNLMEMISKRTEENFRGIMRVLEIAENQEVQS